MLRVETVAEGVADHLIRHYTTMPGIGKAADSLVAAGCFEDSLHGLMITIPVSLRNMPGVAPGNGCE